MVDNGTYKGNTTYIKDRELSSEEFTNPSLDNNLNELINDDKIFIQDEKKELRRV